MNPGDKVAGKPPPNEQDKRGTCLEVGRPFQKENKGKPEETTSTQPNRRSGEAPPETGLPELTVAPASSTQPVVTSGDSHMAPPPK